MSVSIHLLQRSIAEMDQTRLAANWLVHYLDSNEEGGCQVWVDKERLDQGVKQAREDIEDSASPDDLRVYLSDNDVAELQETTDQLKWQLGEILKENKRGFELEICW